jgi:imidazolonepropionase-like amidohydrolase
MSPLRLQFLCLWSLTAGLQDLAAQDLGHKAAPQRQPVVFTHAVLHTVTDGVVLDGTLWCEGGVIRGVLPAGTTPSLPPGSAPLVLDLQGRHVYPGFVSAFTTLGLEELGQVRQTIDLDEVGDLTAEAQAMTAVNPDSVALPVARSNGVLAAGVFPRGGLIAGRAAVIRLDGWTNQDLAVQADAGPVLQWPMRSYQPEMRRRGPRTETQGDDPAAAVQKARDRIDAAFTAARAWQRARAADPRVPHDVRHQALVPALEGKVPVFLVADELEQIESAVRWATGLGLKPVVVGGRDALLCAPLLRRLDVPVVVGAVHRLPRRDDEGYSEPFELPALLAAAGVRFCLASGSDFSQERNLPYQAATAIAFGLDPARALAAITQDAATILGVGDRIGSLGVGKDASLFVSDGDPLALTTRIELAFVQGRQIDLRNKHTELARKYRERYRQMQGR